jgi:alkanesulfonate monooxygenase SsuD/methylene tetrahydromethanopterin reductase-like flavin-dependent oxidoreductase (luciferase family)
VTAPTSKTRPATTATPPYGALLPKKVVEQISVAEHHYSSKQLSPNSILAAGLIAEAVDQIDIGLLGSTLPLADPVRIAEEIGMLDAICDGRLLVGFFRGTPNEFLTYGTNPWESREVFYEQLELLCAIWREPEPFAWLGRHFEYKTVAVWPQPTQRPLPTLVAANSPTSAAYAGQNGYIGGFSFAPAPVVRSWVDVFRAEAEKAGRTITPDDMLYRSFGLIADTDEHAEELYERTQYGNMANLFSLGSGYGMAIAGRISAAMNGVPEDAPLTPPAGPSPFPSRPMFVGSPSTVADQIAAFHEQTGIGRIELTLNDAELPLDNALRSLELYGREVIPQVREMISQPA